MGEILTHATTQINLEDIILSEIPDTGQISDSTYMRYQASLIAQLVTNPPVMQET